MSYGSYGYGRYTTAIPQVPDQPVPDQATSRDAALQQALQRLVKSFTSDPAELLAPQEGPAIGHLGGD